MNASPPDSAAGRRKRVPAMAPEERRAALIAATVPLLREHGILVTTKQIAEAAGVAEGTIFGVFPDKPSLIRAAVLSCFAPEPFERAVSAIDPAQDLRGRLTDVAAIVSRGFAENGKLIDLMRSTAKADDTPGEVHQRMIESRERMIAAIAALVEPDAGRLRVPARTAANLLLILTMATTRHAMGLTGAPPLPPEQIVSLLLDGLLVRDDDPGLFDQIMTAALDETLAEAADRPSARQAAAATETEPGEPV
ncbi:MAG: TetR/AcrR family transcriptional regulator [Hamadaea sp.]|nr:TetR/AcrR family transcriptional regulator [Hamadaea sp.]